MGEWNHGKVTKRKGVSGWKGFRSTTYHDDDDDDKEVSRWNEMSLKVGLVYIYDSTGGGGYMIFLLTCFFLFSDERGEVGREWEERERGTMIYREEEKSIPFKRVVIQTAIPIPSFRTPYVIPLRKGPNLYKDTEENHARPSGPLILSKSCLVLPCLAYLPSHDIHGQYLLRVIWVESIQAPVLYSFLFVQSMFDKIRWMSFLRELSWV